MLESEIKKLTAAIEANTAALTGDPVVIPAAAPAGAASPEIPAAAVVLQAGQPAVNTPAVPVTPDVPAPVVPAAPATLTKKVLTEKFIEVAQLKGREAAQQLLAEYSITSLPELKDKALWPAFFAACEAKIAT